GRGRLHDRCLARLTAAHVFGPDDEVGDDERIVYADPEPETPFGPLARGAYLGYPESMTDASIAGIPARFPRGSLGKTVGLSGFVIDDARTRIVRGAEILIWPSTASSGHFVGTPRATAYA